LLLEESVRDVQTAHILQRGISGDSMERILAETDSLDIFHGPLLMATYLAMFLAAEAAFVLMAIREYLQDLLRIPEESLIFGASAHEKTLISAATPGER
jgi:hypothetical protein